MMVHCFKQCVIKINLSLPLLLVVYILRDDSGMLSYWCLGMLIHTWLNDANCLEIYSVRRAMMETNRFNNMHLAEFQMPSRKLQHSCTMRALPPAFAFDKKSRVRFGETCSSCYDNRRWICTALNPDNSWAIFRLALQTVAAFNHPLRFRTSIIQVPNHVHFFSERYHIHAQHMRNSYYLPTRTQPGCCSCSSRHPTPTRTSGDGVAMAAACWTSHITKSMHTTARVHCHHKWKCLQEWNTYSLMYRGFPTLQFHVLSNNIDKFVVKYMECIQPKLDLMLQEEICHIIFSAGTLFLSEGNGCLYVMHLNGKLLVGNLYGRLTVSSEFGGKATTCSQGNMRRVSWVLAWTCPQSQSLWNRCNHVHSLHKTKRPITDHIPWRTKLRHSKTWALGKHQEEEDENHQTCARDDPLLLS